MMTSGCGTEIKYQGEEYLILAVRYLVRRGTPGLALTTMALHRFVYGMELITLILMSRNFLAAPEDTDAGLEVFDALITKSIAAQNK